MAREGASQSEVAISNGFGRKAKLEFPEAEVGMPRKLRPRLPNGKTAFDMKTVLDIQNLKLQDVRLQSKFMGTRAEALLKEIRRLEEEDKELECIVENLHKEVKQVADAATRMHDMADREDQDAREKKEKLKNCLEQLITDHAEALSDPDLFAEEFYDRLDAIDETIDRIASSSGDLVDPKEEQDSSQPCSGISALSQLNRAHRRKLLVQVELDRIEEELRMEIERNAVSEPASHPVEWLEGGGEVGRLGNGGVFGDDGLPNDSADSDDKNAGEKKLD